ncbi:guanylate cyclase alpha [Capsicum galapagoense]
MACLEMYNKNNNSSTDHSNSTTTNNKHYSMSPRISFSNDFIESSTTSSSQHHQQQMMMKNQERSYSDAPVSSDFEFSVTNYSMISADELFSKGRLLPFKETQKTITTIRDELLNDDDDDDNDFTLTIPKSSTRWKGLLGLKKSHLGSKKIDKKNDEKRPQDLPHATKNSQEMYNGSGSGRDMDFRFN